jgi:hypothetical protein
MMASRGMGAMNPSKMPGKKEIIRKDDPNKVAMYKRGGKVKKMAEGDLVDDVKVKPNFLLLDKNVKAGSARVEGKKSLDKDSDLSAYVDLDAMKFGDKAAKASASKIGFNYTKRFDDGGEVWDKPNPAKKHKKLSPAKKAKAKAAAKAAGRPYPNLIDNMRAAK